MEITIEELRALTAPITERVELSEVACPGSELIGQSVIIRSRDSGVWIGTLEALLATPAGFAATASQARRIWSWRGAAELSQLSQRGVNEAHGDTRIGVVVPSATVLGACEILPASSACVASIGRCAEWTK